MQKSTGTPKERQEETTKSKRRQAPGRTVEARENQLINMSYDLAEKRIHKGQATSQEILHFLKMGSAREQLEKERLEHENELLKAKTEALQSQKRVEELYEKAMKAYRTYSGQEEIIEDD